MYGRGDKPQFTSLSLRNDRRIDQFFLICRAKPCKIQTLRYNRNAVVKNQLDGGSVQNGTRSCSDHETINHAIVVATRKLGSKLFFQHLLFAFSSRKLQES